MTNLRSIAAKKDEAADKQAAEIAKLRDLFDPAYRPQFRPGDIVRFRPAHSRSLLDRTMADRLFIVFAVRREGESWSGFRDTDPDDDVHVYGLTFEKELQRDTLGDLTAPCWAFELVQNADGTEPGPYWLPFSEDAPPELSEHVRPAPDGSTLRIKLQEGKSYDAAWVATLVNTILQYLEDTDKFDEHAGVCCTVARPSDPSEAP